VEPTGVDGSEAVAAGRSRVVEVDEAWSQPLGPLDLLELVLDGLSLLPDFSPTVVHYEARLDHVSPTLPASSSPAAGSGADADGRAAIVFELSVAPARRGTPVLVASPTGQITDLGPGCYRFQGDTGCDHHLTVTVGHPLGPSRTTVISLRTAPVLSEVLPDDTAAC